MKKVLATIGITFALTGQVQATELFENMKLSGITTSFTISDIQPQDEAFTPGREYMVNFQGERFGVWGSYSSFDHYMVTQSLGDLSIIGFGGSYSEPITDRLSFYGHLGIGITKPDYRERVEREAVYYQFVPTFGHPPFMESDGNFWELDYANEIDEYGILGRIGIEYKATENLYIDAGYHFFQVGHYFSNWEPEAREGVAREDLDACGCLWEGSKKANTSGFRLGIKWKF